MRLRPSERIGAVAGDPLFRENEQLWSTRICVKVASHKLSPVAAERCYQLDAALEVMRIRFRI